MVGGNDRKDVKKRKWNTLSCSRDKFRLKKHEEIVPPTLTYAPNPTRKRSKNTIRTVTKERGKKSGI